MVKGLIIFFLAAVFFVVTPIGVYFFSYSQTANLDNQKVKYNLPYPGILPDNPLYFFKSIRDKILISFTRDNVKKAELYLLFSDKKAAMTLSLAQKGKDKLALKTIMQAEDEFIGLSKALTAAKKQGASADSAFLTKVKLANEKHKEVIEILLKDLPQGQTDAINQVMERNKEAKKALDAI